MGFLRFFAFLQETAIPTLPKSSAICAGNMRFAAILCGSLCLAACILLSGCAGTPVAQPGVTTIAASPVVSTQTDQLSPAQVAELVGNSETAAYRLGADDVIAVNVYDHPELTIPAPGVASSVAGALITSDGTVELPLIGTITIGGETIDQAQAAITKAYGFYITDPEVSIQLVQAHSFKYYILGEFSDPGVKYPGHALPLLSALALAGSVNLGSADLYQSFVSQHGVKLPVDLHALLVDGDMSQNILLASGDTIVVPSSASEDAFVFGAVGKPGKIAFNNGNLTLLQALSGAGMGLSDIAAARFRDVRIIRAGGTSAQLIVVDATKTLQGTAGDFDLRPGDIVYVPGTQLGSWNAAINEVLPTLQTVSDLLNPFVSIKYLSQRNN